MAYGSDSDSSSEPSPSPSPPASPDGSYHHDLQDPPSLERLIQHFVSSKRALSITNPVWRANELVTTSRALLEEIAVLNAKSIFAKRGVDGQVETLYAIRDTISDTAASASDEFRATIDKLDLANERLEKTLDDLRNTIVEPSLSKRETSKPTEFRAEDEDEDEGDDDDDEPSKNLYHFIDETRHEELRSSLRHLIDSFNASRGDLDDSLQRLDDSIETIITTLSSASRDSSDGPTHKTTIYDDPPPSIPQLFHSMEDHAGEMATLLQSLVSHYDLCVTALKHTEGGGEAAARALAAAADLTKNTSTGVEESLYGKSGASSMDAAERRELLRVLENDALEVEDVVAELRDRSSALDHQFSLLSAQARTARERHASLHDVLVMLREMRDVALGSHVHALRTFRASWETIGVGIVGKTEEIVALCDFHDAFLGDYDKVVREVERRRSAEKSVRKVVDKARKEIQRLEGVDAEARREFLEEVGRYLPTDLWPAMKNKPVRWEVAAVVPETREDLK